ncbi:MAG: WXG100 family type VII secretion target [Clostridia bacterium]|nr:WXG100 family type VII secretion target [Clostridia bacterium]
MANTAIGWDSALRNISGEIKVTPDELRRQSDTVSAGVNIIRDKFEDAKRLTNTSAAYWNGDAADKFRAVYAGYEDEIQEIIARISEHITDLRSMAGIYEAAEGEAEEAAESLPSDVIV